MDASNDIVRLRNLIDSAIEGLDDLSFALLREASRTSGTRPSADKTLVQSRRALEKASRLLESLLDDG